MTTEIALMDTLDKAKQIRRWATDDQSNRLMDEARGYAKAVERIAGLLGLTEIEIEAAGVAK